MINGIGVLVEVWAVLRPAMLTTIIDVDSTRVGFEMTGKLQKALLRLITCVVIYAHGGLIVRRFCSEGPPQMPLTDRATIIRKPSNMGQLVVSSIDQMAMIIYAISRDEAQIELLKYARPKVCGTTPTHLLRLTQAIHI